MTQLLLGQLPNYSECYRLKNHELSCMYQQKPMVSLMVRAGDRSIQASVSDIATDSLQMSKQIELFTFP